LEENFGRKTLANEPYCRVGKKNFQQMDLAADSAKKKLANWTEFAEITVVLMPTCISD